MQEVRRVPGMVHACPRMPVRFRCLLQLGVVPLLRKTKSSQFQ